MALFGIAMRNLFWGVGIPFFVVADRVQVRVSWEMDRFCGRRTVNRALTGTNGFVQGELFVLFPWAFCRGGLLSLWDRGRFLWDMLTRWPRVWAFGTFSVFGSFKGVLHLADFKRSRNGNIKKIVSKFPTKVIVSVSFIRTRLSQHHPKRSHVAATQGRNSGIRFLSNVFRKGSANYPVKFVM